jgi:hypothetical protein
VAVPEARGARAIRLAAAARQAHAVERDIARYTVAGPGGGVIRAAKPRASYGKLCPWRAIGPPKLSISASAGGRIAQCCNCVPGVLLLLLLEWCRSATANDGAATIGVLSKLSCFDKTLSRIAPCSSIAQAAAARQAGPHCEMTISSSRSPVIDKIGLRAPADPMAPVLPLFTLNDSLSSPDYS